MYGFLFKHFLSRLEPERAHHLAFLVIRSLPFVGVGAIASLVTRPTADLAVNTMGLCFPSPFGLAAGPDKDGKSLRGLGQLGFGHIEVGTLTALPQPGNPKPRLFRLIDDRALINRMGFNNDGALAAAPRLAKVYRRRRRPVIGANVGKSRVVAVEDAIPDYVASIEILRDHVDYFVINVSSPNTPGLRNLQSPEMLVPLLRASKAAAKEKPVLLKIAPDLRDQEIVQIAKTAVSEGLSGIVAINTTVDRGGLLTSTEKVASAGEGGLSGRPLAKRSIEVLRLIHASTPDGFCIVSVGGVTSSQDVQTRLRAGATLVQGYTGFLYEGPLWAARVNRGLRGSSVSKLRRESPALSSGTARA